VVSGRRHYVLLKSPSEGKITVRGELLLEHEVLVSPRGLNDEAAGILSQRGGSAALLTYKPLPEKEVGRKGTYLSKSEGCRSAQGRATRHGGGLLQQSKHLRSNEGPCGISVEGRFAEKFRDSARCVRHRSRKAGYRRQAGIERFSRIAPPQRARSGGEPAAE